MLLLPGRSSRCRRHKRGEAIGVSVCVDELLCVLDLHVPARVFIDVVIDERFVGNDGPRLQGHIAGDLWGTSMNGQTRYRFKSLRYERGQ